MKFLFSLNGGQSKKYILSIKSLIILQLKILPMFCTPILCFVTHEIQVGCLGINN